MTASKAARAQKLQARLEAIETQARQLRERKRDLEQAERKRAQEAQRKADARRRILLGAFVLRAMRKGGRPDWAGFQVNGLHLADYLTRPEDRALFDLPPAAT